MSYSNQPCTRWRRKREIKACCVSVPRHLVSNRYKQVPPSTLKVKPPLFSPCISDSWVYSPNKTKHKKKQKCGLLKISNPIRFVAPLFCCVYLCQQQTSNRARSEIKPLIHTLTHTYSRVNKHTHRGK